MNFRSRLVVLFVSTPILIFVLVGGFLSKVSAIQDSYRPLRALEDVVQLILAGYVEEVDIDQVMEGALRGLSGGLDPDSAYLTRELTHELQQGTAPPAGDVGLTLTRQYYLRVVAARDGSPADRARLRTGDYIRVIDGTATRDMSVFEGARRLRGAPGTTVSLTVIRGNAAEPHVVELVREPATTPTLSDRMVRPAIGYVRVPAFGPDTADALADRVEALVRNGAGHVLLDLRGTAQGELDAGIAAARLFVKSGTLALLASREAEVPERIEARSGDGRLTVPMTLLTSRGTAGAAEIFTAALNGNDRAAIVGERTAGQAALQKLVPLPEQRSLWLTWARYLAPSGELIHARGLEPDEPVAEPEVEFGDPEPTRDPILDAAVARVERVAKPAA
jgi:carboxyl-terminal processing protease